MIHKLLCFFGLHNLKHFAQYVTETSVTEVCKCKHCEHRTYKTSPLKHFLDTGR